MPPPTPRPRRAPVRVVLALLLAAGLVLIPAAPAVAHPFGDPQTVAVASDPAHPEVVRLRWRVGGTDDLTLLGVSLGILPPDRVMLDGAVFFRDTDAPAIAAAPAFVSYLLTRITVASGKRACAGTVQPPGDLARTGAAIDYTCPGPVGTATVVVRTLTDLHPAYQTLASGPAGERAVYRSDQDSHDWVLGDPPAAGSAHPGRAAAVQLSAVLGAVLLVAAGAVLVLRRVRRRAVA